MTSIKPLASFFIVSLLLLSIVAAAGSSTGGSSSSSPVSSLPIVEKKKLNECQTTQECIDKGKCGTAECNCHRGKCLDGFMTLEDADKKVDVEINRQEKTKECESKPTLPARIACRLKNKNLTEDSIPEACRVLDTNNRGRCVSYYAKIQHCYNEAGIEKDKCFREVAGIAKGKIKREDAKKNRQAVKDYISAHLYDLQDKVEKQVGKGKLTADEGSEIIAKITDIKIAVSEGKTKSEIKTMLQELKKIWKEKIKNED